MRVTRVVSRATRAALGTGAAALALVAVDAGSVILTNLSVPDRVRTAGYAATEVAKNPPANRHTATMAHKAAQAEAEEHGITILTKDFVIYPDGRVTLTAVKTAPTLLLKWIPRLEDLAVVSDTTTVRPLPFS